VIGSVISAFSPAAIGIAGARGPAVVPGDVLESLLYRTITHEADIKMPFNQPKLSDVDIKTVRDWIEDGAKW
jgi:hypothetical protein